MNAHAQPWHHLSSTAKRALVKPLWQAGMSAAQIARQVGATRNAVIGVIHRMKQAGQAPASRSPTTTSSRSAATAGTGTAAPSVPALLSVKDSRSNKKVRGGKPNTNRIAAVRSKSEASLDRHIARRMKARIETPKVDPGLPITITKAAAFDPLPGVEPVALVDIPAFGRCRWPVEPDQPGHFMCGAPCDATAKYCCAHKRLSISPYQPQTRKAA